MTRRIALVTGASRGIGRAIAWQLAVDGLTVIVNYKTDTEAADEIVREIAEAGGEAVAKCFDVSDAVAVKKAVLELTEEFGTIEVLVNNAAATRLTLKPLIRVKEDEWNQMIGTNLAGVHNCTQAVVKTWVRGRNGSRIVNIASIGGERGFRDSSTYCASKAGIIGFTKALSYELAPRGVTVNAVSPGWIETDATTGWEPDEFWSHVPLNRPGLPTEVAHLVAFLASDRASYITGEVIRINGGVYT